VLYFDALNDMAVCRLLKDVVPELGFAVHLTKTVFTPELWRGMSDVHEGDLLLCIGNPMLEGGDGPSYPLAATSMVSQVVPGRSWFLIDGGDRRGMDGAAVFLVNPELDNVPPALNTYLVGIVRSFPNDASPLPGFTPVAALENVFPALTQMGLYPSK
jgi:hypothetical protein